MCQCVSCLFLECCLIIYNYTLFLCVCVFWCLVWEGFVDVKLSTLVWQAFHWFSGYRFY